MKRTHLFIATTLFCFAFIVSCASMKMKMEADKAFKSGDFKTAIIQYRNCLTHGDSWKTRIHLGYSLIQDGQVDEAIDMLSEMLEEKNQRPWALYYLGVAYLKKGDRQKAVNMWEQYKNKYKPKVERMLATEIKKQRLLIKIETCEKAAQAACAMESQLQTVSVDPNSLSVMNYGTSSDNKELKPFSKALSAMIISDLSQVKSLKIVERIQMQALVNEMKLGTSGLIDSKTAPRFGKLLGTDKVVVGQVEPGSIYITNTLASVSENKNLGNFIIKGEKADFFKLEKEVVYAMLKTLGIKLTPEEKKAIGDYQTTNIKAFIYYGEALEQFDQKKFDRALELFNMALVEDPDFKMASDGRDNAKIAASSFDTQTLGMPKANSKCGN